MTHRATLHHMMILSVILHHYTLDQCPALRLILSCQNTSSSASVLKGRFFLHSYTILLWENETKISLLKWNIQKKKKNNNNNKLQIHTQKKKNKEHMKDGEQETKWHYH
jgi:hypothetical protein